MIWWLKQTRWILVGIVLAGVVTDARALDPNRLPSQYVREQWTTATRFPGGAVNGIAQTADGYLWIGTDRGLIRFDGFNFRPVSLASIAAAANVPILQLLTDAGGRLWVRPQGADLVRQKDGKFESVRYGPVAITALSKDNHDGVLVSDIAQGTFRFTARPRSETGTRFTASHLAGRNSRRQYLDGHTRRWPVSSQGRASYPGERRIARPKDQFSAGDR